MNCFILACADFVKMKSESDEWTQCHSPANGETLRDSSGQEILDESQRCSKFVKQEYDVSAEPDNEHRGEINVKMQEYQCNVHLMAKQIKPPAENKYRCQDCRAAFSQRGRTKRCVSKMRPETIGGGVFDNFLFMKTSARKQLVMSYSVWL